MANIDLGALLSAMTTAGENLGSSAWGQMQTYAIPELQKIAQQIVTIAANINDYTPDGAKALLNMQLNASVGVIVAMTTMTLLDVQTAINSILNAVKGQVNGVIGFALLA
jgi:Na+/H+-translocating membrane pyrophosphatase